jgi:hypothetical protein
MENIHRIIHKTKQCLDDLELNLNGKTVLTEGATGAYSITPILASLAGAQVYAFTQDTKYGTVKEVFNELDNMASAFNAANIHYVHNLTNDIINKADIITNSGHLRPLDKNKLQHTNPGVVIPLMYEAWELREHDLDIAYCRNNQIAVGATNERHPGVGVFDYLGDMAIKLILDAGLPITKSKFVLLTNNQFGPYIAAAFANKNCSLGIIGDKKHKDQYPSNADWLDNFPSLNNISGYEDADAVIFTAYPFDISWIGNNESAIPARIIKEKFDHPLILRYAGDINTNDCHENKVPYYPKDVASGHMGVLPSDIGHEPIIRLQAGGLKCGELMLENQTHFKGVPLVEII